MSYAKRIVDAKIELGEDEQARTEKLIIYETGQEELRFSWWTQGGSRF